MKRGGNGRRTATLRAMVLKNHDGEPDVILGVNKGPRGYLMDIFKYNIADSENYIENTMKGFPKPPYREKIMRIKYRSKK
jgi:hypothetical protein